MRIRSLGRRSVRAQCEKTHRFVKGGMFVVNTPKGPEVRVFKAGNPVIYSPEGGQAMRADRFARGAK